jgi:hypothetical protein
MPSTSRYMRAASRVTRKDPWGSDGNFVEEWFRDGEALEYDEFLLHKMEDEWDPSVADLGVNHLLSGALVPA